MIRVAARAKAMAGAPSRFISDRARCDERGMTLVELLVATVVFAAVATASMVALGSSLNLSRNNRNRSIAANLASAKMDELRSMDFESLPEGHHVWDAETVDGVAYTVTSDSAWVSKNATTGACDGPSGTLPAYMQVVVRVSWPNMAGVKPVESETVLNPPVGVYDPLKGHLAVKVIDAEANPVTGQTVTVTGPSGFQSSLVSADGCAFFAYLEPDTYTATLDTAGYVDAQGVQAVSQVAGVNQASTTSLLFQYDEEATLEVEPAGMSVDYVVPPGLEVTVANTGLALGKTSFATSSYPAVVTDLFPFTSGYQVWMGSCADADPQGQQPGSGGPYYPSGQREAALPVTPGQTTSAAPRLKSVDLQVATSSGPVIDSAVQVLAVHVPPVDEFDNPVPDEGCPSGKTISIPGTTDSNGVLKIAMPYGRWEFQVSGFSPQGGFWPEQVLDPSVTDPQAVTVTVQ